MCDSELKNVEMSLSLSLLLLFVLQAALHKEGKCITWPAKGNLELVETILLWTILNGVAFSKRHGEGGHFEI